MPPAQPKQPIVKRFRSSSAILSMRYDPEAETLEVTFSSGATYTLDGVPEQEAIAFANASSPGTYFNQFLKGNY